MTRYYAFNGDADGLCALQQLRLAETHRGNLVTGVKKRLTATPGGELGPSWSPDGSRIAFASERSGQFQIWTMDAAGGSVTRLTHTSSPEMQPTWSH